MKLSAGKLNNEQTSAAHRLGQDVCVVAGPGSGKTSVLIERFVWLVRQQQIDPARILTITFTEKAATEIKERLLRAFAGDTGMREQIEHCYVSTIHAFGTRILRENAIAAGVDPQFEVANESIGPALLRKVSDQVLESMYRQHPREMRVLLRSLAVSTAEDSPVPDIAQSFRDIYEALRIAGTTFDQVPEPPPPDPANRARFRSILHQIAADQPKCNTSNQRATHAALQQWATSYLALSDETSIERFTLLKRAYASPLEFKKNTLLNGSVAERTTDELRALAETLHAEYITEYYSAQRPLILSAIRQIDEAYREAKLSRSLLDFSDLEEQTLRLLSGDPSLRSRLQYSFDHILMDELQDTNPLQWKIIEQIRQPNRFFAVGDVNQSIFGFRHAEPRLFHDYRARIEALGQTVDRLLTNYRSRASVLNAVNEVFKAPPCGIEQHVLAAKREDYPPKQVPSVECILAFDPDQDIELSSQLEAQWIAIRILELVGSMIIGASGQERLATFHDVAILARTSGIMAEIQVALDRFHIPFVASGSTFYQSREIRDLVLLLKLVANPRDEVALAGVLRSPFAGVSGETLLRLRTGKPLCESLDSVPATVAQRDADRIQLFWKKVKELRLERDAIPPSSLLSELIDEFDYENGLSLRARANIEKFLAKLRTWSAQPGPSVSRVLQLISQAQDEAEAAADAGDAVQIVTIHRSKGLEFPIVFVPSLHRGGSGGFPVVAFKPGLGVGIRWRDPDSGDGCGDSVHRQITAFRKEAELAEENRLLYVAMTRAEEHLVLSFGQSKRPTEWVKLVPSTLGISTKAPTQAGVEQTPRGIRVLRALPSAVPLAVPEPATLREAELTAEHIQLIPTAKPVGQYDGTASVTSVTLFTVCPRKYYLSRYIKWQQPARLLHTGEDAEDDMDMDFNVEIGVDSGAGTGELDSAEFGTMVHSLLANKPVENAPLQARELANRFERSPLGHLAALASAREHEFDFLFDMEGMVLRGQIDLWFEHRGKLHIVDYKTGHVRFPASQDRIEPYALQLRFYALALERMTGKPVKEAALHFLRPDVVVPVDTSPLQLGTTYDQVAEFREAHETLNFPLRPGGHCGRCEFYRGACPAGKIAAGK